MRCTGRLRTQKLVSGRARNLLPNDPSAGQPPAGRELEVASRAGRGSSVSAFDLANIPVRHLAIPPGQSHQRTARYRARHGKWSALLGVRSVPIRERRFIAWRILATQEGWVEGRDRLREVWEPAIEEFLQTGHVPIPCPLNQWYHCYPGTEDDPPLLNALPEPWLGSIDHRPAAVYLSLNPGRAYTNHPHNFQGHRGAFADEIRQLGSYEAWAASWPFLRDPWVQGGQGVEGIGPNTHHLARHRFVAQWVRSDIGPGDVLAFELYPWHTTRIRRRLRPPVGVVRELVWEPIAELGRPPVFAFGSPWFHLAADLELSPMTEVLAPGGDYPTNVASRRVQVFEDKTTGVRLLVEKHTGSASPPSPLETDILRGALDTMGVSML